MQKKTTNPIEIFHQELEERIASNKTDEKLKKSTVTFMKEIARTNYGYNFSWLGRPVIQLPQDLMAMQEIIWEIKPDYIIETGIAHGGSIIFYASILELIGNGKVIGIDIDIRQHNRIEIEKHSLYHRIEMIEGSSISKEINQKVKKIVGENKKVLVCLDSNHSHNHVLAELELYSPLVSVGSYCVVFDTSIEDLSEVVNSDRPWGPGNNPKTAVHEFLRSNNQFKTDKNIEAKILLTAAPDGYLKRV